MNTKSPRLTKLPKFEAYEVGHVYNLKFLESSGLLKPPYWIQFVLGVLGGIAATPETLLMMRATTDHLFGRENYSWSAIGVGHPQVFQMVDMAIKMGGHVRVCLEDNTTIRRKTLATNPGLIEKVVRLANGFEREIARPDEARARLGLNSLEAVKY
jgi:uncharacterized protein (DUF849 family)